MKNGTVKFFNTEKGFGFIRLDNGEELFYHVTDCTDNVSPAVGEEVLFVKA